jgi:hypothetical protein
MNKYFNIINRVFNKKKKAFNIVHLRAIIINI